MQYARLIYAGASVIMVLGFFATVSNFLVRLELYHREKWTSFGSPKIIPASPLSQFRLLRYIIMGEYRILGDAVLSKQAFWVRLDLVAFLFLLLFPYVFLATFGYPPY
jgi:hypothetical protein